jgi:Asp-tRNA(Asn)/Glu-tRNA(Gln) amidotransferase A subunit family amidase
MDLCSMSAVQAAAAIRDGELTSLELVESCLARIDEREDSVQAWQHLDRDFALDQARRADAVRQAAQPLGPLHGVPVGVKDIFDTRDLPTENGSPLHAGRQPTQDASVVSQLREAGAVILGKTVTTEFAVYSPGKTRNPHNPEHTPGGSSSGSAAAVACGMVPLALGSQTNGSVIRPASYCGVVGYKPTHGLISRRGVLALSRPLDTIGVFARDLPDAALMAQSIMAFDPGDPDMSARARPRLAELVAQEPPLPPQFVFVRSPVWDEATPDCREAFAELAEFLGEDIDEFELPDTFAKAYDWHRAIMHADLAKSLAPEYQRGEGKMSQKLRGMIADGQKVAAVDYNRSVDWIEVLNQGLAELFERYDAILTPAAGGEAPQGLESTGSPAFCTLWTYLGLPAVSLPLLEGEGGLPIGVQLVGARGDDARLLRSARALMDRVTQETDT